MGTKQYNQTIEMQDHEYIEVFVGRGTLWKGWSSGLLSMSHQFPAQPWNKLFSSPPHPKRQKQEKLKDEFEEQRNERDDFTWRQQNDSEGRTSMIQKKPKSSNMVASEGGM